MRSQYGPIAAVSGAFICCFPISPHRFELMKGMLHCCIFLFRVFFRQHFHMKAILYCGIDPDKRYHEYAAVALLNHSIECSREHEYLTCFRKKSGELREVEMGGY